MSVRDVAKIGVQERKKGKPPVNDIPSSAPISAPNFGLHCYSMAQHGTTGVIMKKCRQGVGCAFRPLFAGVWHMLTHGGTVRHTKKKWRPKCKAVKYSCTTIKTAAISINTNILRFNPVQIGEWLAELLERGVFKSRQDMAQEFGLHHIRIGQFLALMKLSAKERRQYKEDGEVREYQLRALRCG